MTVSAYWTRYNACDSCPAAKAEPCYRLSSGGPEALPPQYADKAHPRRPLTATVTAITPEPPKRARAVGAQRSQPARRTASRAQSTADAWRALAAKKAKG